MDKSPLVSVILPCYNAEVFLKEALDSILEQSYSNIEVILIDDGSTDQSAKVYVQKSKEDSRLKIYNNPSNLGLIKTLNKGILLAKGEFIARMDADDVSVKDRIAHQVEFLLKHHEISIVGTAALRIDEHSKPHRTNNPIYLDSNTISLSSYFTQPLIHGSILGRKSVFEKQHYSLDYEHSEDFELWLRLISQKHQIANLPFEDYHYRINEQGVSLKNTQQQNRSHNQASKKYLELLLGKTLDYDLVSIMNNRPETNVNIVKFRKSIALFKEVVLKLNRKNTKELKMYLIHQVNNIILQSIKKPNDFFTLIFLIFNLILRFRYKQTLIQLFKK